MFQTRVSNFSDNISLGRFLFPLEKLFFFVSASFCRRFDLDTLLSTELRTSMRNKSTWLACTRFLSTFRRSLSNSTRKCSSSLRFAKQRRRNGTANYPGDYPPTCFTYTYVSALTRCKLVERTKRFTIIGSDVRVRISERIDLLLMYQIRYYLKTIGMSE